MIAAAQKLQSGNVVEYSDNEVAQISSIREAIDPSQVQFVQVATCTNKITRIHAVSYNDVSTYLQAVIIASHYVIMRICIVL